MERLWLLVILMKDKTQVGACGSVLNKTAEGDDYWWGVRFYILLIECFREWATFTDDTDFSDRFEWLKKVVPYIDEDIYYF